MERVTTQKKTAKHCYAAMLFIMLYEVVLTLSLYL